MVAIVTAVEPAFKTGITSTTELIIHTTNRDPVNLIHVDKCGKAMNENGDLHNTRDAFSSSSRSGSSSSSRSGSSSSSRSGSGCSSSSRSGSGSSSSSRSGSSSSSRSGSGSSSSSRSGSGSSSSSRSGSGCSSSSRGSSGSGSAAVVTAAATAVVTTAATTANIPSNPTKGTDIKAPKGSGGTSQEIFSTKPRLYNQKGGIFHDTRGNSIANNRREVLGCLLACEALQRTFGFREV
ncbi:secreted protein C-like [Penaeus vannamei]|uniref:secreted protein C-like n=1 Tax=Penaeus vannamei TaxID=6689 RepID=UPI00387F7869